MSCPRQPPLVLQLVSAGAPGLTEPMDIPGLQTSGVRLEPGLERASWDDDTGARMATSGGR